MFPEIFETHYDSAFSEVVVVVDNESVDNESVDDDEGQIMILSHDRRSHKIVEVEIRPPVPAQSLTNHCQNGSRSCLTTTFNADISYRK